MRVKIITAIGTFYALVTEGFGEEELESLVENIQRVKWMEGFDENGKPLLLPKGLLLQSGYMLAEESPASNSPEFGGGQYYGEQQMINYEKLEEEMNKLVDAFTKEEEMNKLTDTFVKITNDVIKEVTEETQGEPEEVPQAAAVELEFIAAVAKDHSNSICSLSKAQKFNTRRIEEIENKLDEVASLLSGLDS